VNSGLSGVDRSRRVVEESEFSVIGTFLISETIQVAFLHPAFAEWELPGMRAGFIASCV